MLSKTLYTIIIVASIITPSQGFSTLAIDVDTIAVKSLFGAVC